MEKIRLSIFLLLIATLGYAQSNQTAKFSSFEGTIYDMPPEDLSLGFNKYVSGYDELGKVNLKELSISRTNQFSAYFPGAYVRDGFAIIFNSSLEVSQTGCYEFYLESDDGSKLWIENAVVIDNDGPHKMKALRDTLSLKEGVYPVKLWYYNAYPSQYGLILSVNTITDSTLCTNVKHRFELNNVLFDFNSSSLLHEGQLELDRISRLLNGMEIKRIKVVGHTDNAGTEKYNNDLSLRRAKSVADYLKLKLICDISLSIEGKGSSSPIADPGAPDAQSKNRRVEIYIE